MSQSSPSLGSDSRLTLAEVQLSTALAATTREDPLSKRSTKSKNQRLHRSEDRIEQHQPLCG